MFLSPIPLNLSHPLKPPPLISPIRRQYCQPRSISLISLTVSPSLVMADLTPRLPSISPSSLSSLPTFHSASLWLWVFFFFFPAIWVDWILVSNCGGWFAVEVSCSGGDGGFWYDGWVVGDGGLWGWYEFCVCFLNCRRQVGVQLIWVVVGCGLWVVTVAVVVVGCGGDGRWWLSVLLQQWILVVGGWRWCLAVLGGVSLKFGFFLWVFLLQSMGFWCNLFNLWGFLFFYFFAAIWVDLILPYWWVIVMVGLQSRCCCGSGYWWLVVVTLMLLLLLMIMGRR